MQTSDRSRLMLLGADSALLREVLQRQDRPLAVSTIYLDAVAAGLRFDGWPGAGMSEFYARRLAVIEREFSPDQAATARRRSMWRGVAETKEMMIHRPALCPCRCGVSGTTCEVRWHYRYFPERLVVSFFEPFDTVMDFLGPKTLDVVIYE